MRFGEIKSRLIKLLYLLFPGRLASMINVAVVGTGRLGSQHAANFAQIAGCRVKRVYDLVAENAENCAEPLGAEVASDFEQCLADDIDAVIVVTPTDVHAEYCIKAAQAGKHVFCEKPMTRTLDETDQVVETVEAAGVKMMVGHVLRFFPEYETARQMIQDEQLGDVGMIRMARISVAPTGWFGDLQRSGGVILDMIIHDFDWLLWTLGPPERIYAQGLYEQLPALDYALCTFRFSQGTVAFVEGSWAAASGFRTSFEITGSGGLLAHDSTESTTLIAQRRGGDGKIDESAYLPMTPTAKSPLQIEEELFIAAVENDSEPPITARDGREAVRLALAVLESAQTDRVIHYA